MTRRVKLIEEKEFPVAVFNPDHKTFIVYIIAFNISFDLGNKVQSL